MLQDPQLGFQAIALEKVEAIPEYITGLFQMLNDAGIRYCHWKSNLRLERGLCGKTDLDLLIDPTDRQQLMLAFEGYGVIPVLAPPGRHYPSIEDYLGFDPLSGCLFHFHVHYQLVLG